MFRSIFNDVIGPVMRGPSSSHTAGSYHIGRLVHDLLGEQPTEVDITFDVNGSYAMTYIEQGADQAFITGVMGWKLTDPVFFDAHEESLKLGTFFRFHKEKIPQADHPNFVIINAQAENIGNMTIKAKSIGGGTFKITQLNEYKIDLDGKSYVLLAESELKMKSKIFAFIELTYPEVQINYSNVSSENVLIQISLSEIISADFINRMMKLDGVNKIYQLNPVYFTKKGNAPFLTAEEMLATAGKTNSTLGRVALEYEMQVLHLNEEFAIAEMLRRYDIMKRSAQEGFDDENVNMLLLEPTAGTIRENIKNNQFLIGGIHSKAAANAVAILHSCNSRGVVCAAPTGGGAGALPGAIIAMEEEFNIDRKKIALMLFAAGGIGLILAIRGTFAAEIAGCQVEIGAAGAMGAASVVEFAKGSAKHACDAASISFQNSMGSVCDLVQGICEIPCHTRNAAAASSAFTNADLVLNGYINHIPLDETIDAVISSGKLLPSELCCTSRGGLAITPSAMKMKVHRRKY